VTRQPPTPHHYQTQNFEGTDLRGRSFSGSWRRADFRRVITGLSPIQSFFLQTFALFMAVLAGFIAAYAGATFSHIAQDQFWLLGLATGLLIVFFFGITLRSGLSAALGILSVFTVSLVVVTVALTEAQIAGLVALSLLAIGGSVAGSVGLATAVTLVQAQPILLFCSTLGLILGSLFGLLEPITTGDILRLLALSLPALGLGSYLGHRTLQGDPRFKILQALAINLSNWKSTNFRTSDLTEADFSGADLRCTDFSHANLTRTRWHNAVFRQNNLQGTYLANPEVRNLVTTLKGQNGTFDRFDLREVNLDNADLTGASFIGADLSNATLRGANLTNAKLAQTQLYGADLTGAILTGAYIENWGISPETHLESIQCDYIYLRLPTDDNPDPYRKPDNREKLFESNDFTNFIAPILNTLKAYKQQTLSSTADFTPTKTLDLFHREGIDAIAAAIALQELINQNPQAQIKVLSVEGIGQKIRIQASITSGADSSKLNTRYFHRYDQLVTQSQSDVEALFETLATQHAQLRALEARITSATGNPFSYVTVSPASTIPLRRSAMQRKRDRLNRAIDQQSQRLDDWEAELEVVNAQWAVELDETSRLRLQRGIQQLENNLTDGEAKLAELEQQLADIPPD
jgi:uncharacterized protein YjbI with pentapeptide repeats